MKVIDNQELRIQEIQKLEKEEERKIKTIKNLLASKKQEDIKTIAQTFIDIGDLNVEISKLDNDNLTHYTDATTLYNYAINLIKYYREQEKEIEMLYSKLGQIKTDMILRINGKKIETCPIKQEINDHKEILSKLRESNYKKMIEWHGKGLIGEEYSKYVRDEYIGIAEKMQGFLAKIYEEAIKEINIIPPCKYSVIGLGSMALKQVTPYSDLEFAILVENDTKEEIQKYFMNLTHLVHFKVINLGETIIPGNKYNVDLSSIEHRGVNFDLGGKTPLGRIDKPYKLICTVEHMLKYTRNDDDKIEHIDKVLPIILEKTCYISGDKSLFEEYDKSVQAFLKQDSKIKGMTNGQARALKYLQTGSIEINYLKADINNTIKRGNLQEFQPLSGSKCKKSLNIKQEIYRVIDRLLYNLNLFFGIEYDNQFDALDVLSKKGIIDKIGAKHSLMFVLAKAEYLRCITYHGNKAQNETIYIYSQDGDEKLPTLSKIDTLHLQSVFGTLASFHRKISAFCKKMSKSELIIHEQQQAFFQNEKYEDETSLTQGLIQLKLGNFQYATKLFHTEYKKCKNFIEQKESLLLLFDAYYLWCLEGRTHKDLYIFSEIKEAILTVNQSSVTDLYVKYANLSLLLHQYNDALEYLQKTTQYNYDKEELIIFGSMNYEVLQFNYLQDFIKQNKVSIAILPKVYAYYLLIRNYDSFKHIDELIPSKKEYEQSLLNELKTKQDDINGIFLEYQNILDIQSISQHNMVKLQILSNIVSQTINIINKLDKELIQEIISNNDYELFIAGLESLLET